jgi:hypothetical protein
MQAAEVVEPYLVPVVLLLLVSAAEQEVALAQEQPALLIQVEAVAEEEATLAQVEPAALGQSSFVGPDLLLLH